MDLSSEMNRHGKNPVSHKLEDQKKVRQKHFLLRGPFCLCLKRIFKLKMNVF